MKILVNSCIRDLATLSEWKRVRCPGGCVSEIEGGNVRRRPPVKWRDRVQEYVRERGEGSLRNLELARGECLDRERWKSFWCGHPLMGVPRSKASKMMRVPYWRRSEFAAHIPPSLLRRCPRGRAASVAGWESAGQGSIPAAHPAVHPSFALVDKWVPGETWGR